MGDRRWPQRPNPHTFRSVEALPFLTLSAHSTSWLQTTERAPIFGSCSRDHWPFSDSSVSPGHWNGWLSPGWGEVLTAGKPIGHLGERPPDPQWTNLCLPQWPRVSHPDPCLSQAVPAQCLSPAGGNLAGSQAWDRSWDRWMLQHLLNVLERKLRCNILFSTQITRKFRLNSEGKLEQTVSMATTTQPMTQHLRVTYKKVTP